MLLHELCIQLSTASLVSLTPSLLSSFCHLLQVVRNDDKAMLGHHKTFSFTFSCYRILPFNSLEGTEGKCITMAT